MQELAAVIQRLGFTPLQNIVQDFFFEASGRDSTSTSDLDFDDFVTLLEVVQSRQGFTKAEIAMLMDAFELFRKPTQRPPEESPGLIAASGSSQVRWERSQGDEAIITSYRLLQLLRWVGFNPRVEVLAHFFKEEDLGSSGSFDRPHFLQAMRRFREEELRSLRHVFSSLKLPLEAEPLSAEDLGNAFHRQRQVDFPLDFEACGKLLGKASSFDTLVAGIDMCRQEYALAKRKRAGFTEEQVKIITRVFEEITAGNERGLSVQEHWPWLLASLGTPMKSKEQRADVLECAEMAGRTARAAGCQGAWAFEEDKRFMRLPVLLHALRNVAELGEKEQVEREMQAMMQTHFSPTEVRDFREVFKANADIMDEPPRVEMTRRHSLYINERSRSSIGTVSMSLQPSNAEGAAVAVGRHAPPPQADKETEILRPCFEVLKMSKDAVWGLVVRTMRGDSRYALALGDKVGEIVSPATTVDFADFLRVMRWVANSIGAQKKDGDGEDQSRPSSFSR
mmetsp:Transcript_105452/g.339570  ORF Transcript_105452/g.339570 Transcript_105452/m.339570 type:complete len:508 (+) Transcript_105452:1240-2763(+)